MESYKRDYYIARIRAGYIPISINNKRFKVEAPNEDILLESHEVYINAYEEAVEDEMLNEDELLSFLIIQDIWSETMEEEYQKIVPGHIEYWKMELYKSLLKSKTKETMRKYLETAKEEYERLFEIRHRYDYATIDGYANYARSLFLIEKCTTLNGKPVNWNDYNLIKIMTKYHESILRPDDIRELSRTSPWVNIWPVMKSNRTTFKHLTIEQQSLLTWTNMYDRIYESPDCPSDEVVSDDDMLDGWLLIQKKKREAEKQQGEVQSAINPRIANADEVFVPAQTIEDARKIDTLNSGRGRSVKMGRMKQLKEKGVMKQQEFSDVQQKRRMDMQQAYNSKMRK